MNKSDQEKTILLVDDEEDIRDVIGISLTDIGYNVHAVQNGKEAMQLFDKINPMIVLTDIKMPEMDGIELLQKVKQMNPDTEVIMITGHGDMNLAIKSLKHEATDFITKPINIDALDIALKRANDRIIIKQRLREYTESLEALLREKTQLQDHLASLGLMIGSISHGIKGLLTGLDGGIYILDAGFEKNDKNEIDEGWDIVKIMIGRVRKMVHQILFYTKKKDLELKKVKVMDFVDAVAMGVESKCKDSGIEFLKNFHQSGQTFIIDTDALQSALLNILENAIYACAKDKTKDSHVIEFNVRTKGSFILFEISDNGMGMNEETVKKIFTLFFSSKGDSGTGLGLFITGKIIDMHNGVLKVESTPDKGTKFTIKIPKNLRAVQPAC